MENIGGTPNPAEARAALAGIESVQRAVRDTPWPTWLYLTNATLLGAMALTALLGEHRGTALLAVATAVVAVNMTAGYRMGIPWTLPASRTFLASVAVSVFCAAAAMLLDGGTWPTVALAVAATATYLAGSVAHRRSTGQPR